MTIFCGIDWVERHHDVALVDDTGILLAKARITDDAAGYNKVLELLAEHGDGPDAPIPVAIETSHGLLVATLRAGNRKVFAINPLAASRYRDRHGVSRKKSDPGDALVLANILRTDMAMHRPEVLSERRARLLADPLQLTVNGVVTLDQSNNLTGLERQIASVEAATAPDDTTGGELVVAPLRRAHRWHR